jgi:phospholipid/cholesterol/gamma-HCH transport system substrate-binding protein
MKSFHERNPVSVGGIGGLVMLVLGLVVYQADDLPVIGGGTAYTAEFTEAAGLRPGDEVRVAGVKVGEVDGLELEGDHATVTFTVSDIWLGDRTTAAITIKTLLGQKNLVLDPLGSGNLDPGKPIPRERTTSPYDVNEAFGDLATAAGAIDTDQLAEAFRTLSQTLGATAPEDVHAALDGMSALSRTLASRDEELRTLFAGTNEITTTIADRTGQFDSLIKNGNVLLTELNSRKDAIGRLFTGTRNLAEQLQGLVADNQATLGPALDQLDRVATVLQRNQDKLSESLRLAGPFYRLVGNAVGNGRWVEGYICGLVPAQRPGSCVPPRDGGR